MASNGKSVFNLLKKVLLFTLLAIIAACASIQSPTGGPRDRQAPKVLEERPKNLTRNFTSKRIEIEFDEFIKLGANESKEISISPALDKNPIFKVKKKILEITFQDTLENNTTYTINFGKALIDYNEGNILKNYSYVFATGPVLDSLSISGTVINAVTKKPELEATVLLIPLKQDTIFGKKSANIFAFTDSSGNFRIQNLRANTYKIYGLKEPTGGDRIYNSANETVAFLRDSIVLSQNMADIRLELFQEEPSRFRMLENRLISDGHFLFRFNKRLRNPSIQLIDEPTLNSRKTTEFNAKGDSALMWLPEITFDSLRVAIHENNVSLDTVIFRRSKKDTYNQVLSISDNLISNGKVRQNKPLALTFSAPVRTIDENAFTLLSDSIPVDFTLEADSNSTRRYLVKYNWREKKKYILQIADNAITSINGAKSKSQDKAFTLDPDINYGTIIAKIVVPDTTTAFVVQLLDKADEILRATPVTRNATLTYAGYPPGKYHFRVVYDLNKNREWDSGNVEQKRQPEPIWNFPTELELLPNFELEPVLTIPAAP